MQMYVNCDSIRVEFAKHTSCSVLLTTHQCDGASEIGETLSGCREIMCTLFPMRLLHTCDVEDILQQELSMKSLKMKSKIKEMENENQEKECSQSMLTLWLLV